ncbi:MAG: carboxypeptidase-like regulatory domain-containing protein [Armatimonadetes bacterium]|nr:carboxypeptidase-like regulatory domain-containing protein [Armatimonadota bacterium]
MKSKLLLFSLAALIAVALAGCAGVADLIAYIGGGLPPGDDDIGGIVVAAAPTVTSADPAAPAQAATVPVPDAEVIMYQGQHEVGRTTTGPEGYFRFQQPATGQYSVVVTPPAGSGLQQARRQFQHQRGQQTFLTIVLEPTP